MKTMHSSTFSGFTVGAIASAVLLAFGIESLVAMLNDPIADAVIGALNWIIRTGRFDVVLLQPVYAPWILVAYTGLSGVVLLLSGIRLAVWLSGGAGSASDNSRKPSRNHV